MKGGVLLLYFTKNFTKLYSTVKSIHPQNVSSSYHYKRNLIFTTKFSVAIPERVIKRIMGNQHTKVVPQVSVLNKFGRIYAFLDVVSF